jgi:predicted nucleic acid-binding protein
MRGYLLDNNHVSALFQKVPEVVARFQAVPLDSQIRVCTITLGEIEAGHLIAKPADAIKQDDYNRFLNEYFVNTALDITTATRIDYAEILAAIWQANAPATHRVRTEAHLVSLGVDINDLWTVAVAREHNLIFATQDKMKVIRKAAPDVQFDCWLPEPEKPANGLMAFLAKDRH